MSLTTLCSFIWLWVQELSWSQCLWGRGGLHHFVCLESLVLQRGCSSNAQIWALSLCMSWQIHMAHCVFRLFFCQSFVDSVAFWCYPSTCCKDSCAGCPNGHSAFQTSSFSQSTLYIYASNISETCSDRITFTLSVTQTNVLKH